MSGNARYSGSSGQMFWVVGGINWCMKLQDGLDLKKFICVTTALYVHQTSLGHLSYIHQKANLSLSAIRHTSPSVILFGRPFTYRRKRIGLQDRTLGNSDDNGRRYQEYYSSDDVIRPKCFRTIKGYLSFNKSKSNL